MTTQSLLALEARLEAATGPSREIDWQIWNKIEGQDKTFRDPQPFYTASLDAAVALVERVLPKVLWEISKHQDMTFAEVWCSEEPLDIRGECWTGTTAPLALCLALVRALIAKAETDV